MSNLIPGNQKHMTLGDRCYIEDSLNAEVSFKDIARYLCKDPTTISKEIRLHRLNDVQPKRIFNNPHNFCTKRFRCKRTNVCEKIIICDTKCASCIKCNQVCNGFEKEHCNRLEKAPYT
ncbi:MAG: helix-turn-helix domain-containing protein, partial [Lachnospiraceae bacterium]